MSNGMKHIDSKLMNIGRAETKYKKQKWSGKKLPHMEHSKPPLIASTLFSVTMIL